MKLLQQTGTKQGIVTVSTCIYANCQNTTSSFYCDECWERLKGTASPEAATRR